MYLIIVQCTAVYVIAVATKSTFIHFNKCVRSQKHIYWRETMKTRKRRVRRCFYSHGKMFLNRFFGFSSTFWAKSKEASDCSVSVWNNNSKQLVDFSRFTSTNLNVTVTMSLPFITVVNMAACIRCLATNEYLCLASYVTDAGYCSMESDRRPVMGINYSKSSLTTILLFHLLSSS